LPPGLFTSESYEAWVDMAERFREAKGMLVNSCDSLVRYAVGYFIFPQVIYKTKCKMSYLDI
jgi:hypothetical protein